MSKNNLDDYSRTFSKHLQMLMDINGYSSIRAFAAAFGVPDATINRYINLVNIPKLNNVAEIAKFFNVSVDWLIGYADHGLTPEEASVAKLFSSASKDDRKVIEMILSKYKEGRKE